MAGSLAETRMKILGLEHGNWIKPAEFPRNSPDWEALRHTDFATLPNRRTRDTDYPVNDDNYLVKVANFTAVGASTVVYTTHFPRMPPSDF